MRDKGYKITVQDNLKTIITDPELFYWPQHKYYQITVKVGSFVHLPSEAFLQKDVYNSHKHKTQKKPKFKSCSSKNGTALF